MQIDYFSTTNTDGGTDEKVKVSRLDPKSEHLANKLISSDNSIIIAIQDNTKIDLKALSGNAKYIHVQEFEAQEWMVHHNLNNNYVTTFTIDWSKQQIFGNVINLNENVTKVIFTIPVKGYAVIF